MRNQSFSSVATCGVNYLVIEMKAPELKEKKTQERHGRTRATRGTYLSLPCPVPLHVPWHQSPIPSRPTPTDGCSRACFSSSPLYPSPALPCFHVYAEVGLFLVPTKDTCRLCCVIAPCSTLHRPSILGLGRVGTICGPDCIPRPSQPVAEPSKR